MTPSQIDPRTGTELAGYRVESLLGRGGMGVVYLANDLRLERKIALKLITPELAADPRFRARFLRESRLAASLDHSHVVPVYAAGETDGQLWIAMRYVQGTDLRTLLESDGPLEAARALALVAQVASALDAAHAHGLVHRDVKPANVLVTEEDGEEHCYLTDFGLARSPEVTGDPGADTHLSGTVDYTAPEQVTREPADSRADIYSLACVLYECLVGEPPFRRSRAAATLFAHVSEPPPSLHERQLELPEAVDEVIATALAKDPGERYETSGELCRAARMALGLGGPRFTRRQLLLAGTGATIAVAAAAAIPAILLSSGSEASAPPAILPVTEDSVVRIDPQTGEAVAAIAAGASPVVATVGEGAIWLVTTGDRLLSRLDPGTNEIVASVGFPPALPESPHAIVAGEGAVWTLHANGLLKYDPPTATWLPLPDNIELAKDDYDFAEDIRFAADIAVGHGAIWVTSSDILRIDPETGAVLGRIRPPGDAATLTGPGWLAAGEGGIWHASPLGHIALIEAETNTVTHGADVSEALGDIAFGEGAVWAINATDDLVLRIDPATGQVTGTVRVGRLPTAVTAGAGAVWVASGRDGTLTRIDPVTFDKNAIDLGGAATDVAVGLGGVWVTVDVR